MFSKKISVILVFLFLFSSVYAQEEYVGNDSKIKISLNYSLQLKENEQPLGEIKDFAIDDEGDIFVIDYQSASIIRYDNEGFQRQITGKKGKGPYEFISPSNISIVKDKVSVWDKELLRFSELTKEGEPLFELTDFSSATAYIEKDGNLIIAYEEGSPVGPVIKIYNLDKKMIEGEYGKKSDEHTLLMTLDGSGGFTIDDDKLFYVLADKLTVNKVGLENASFNKEEFSVHIPNFKTEKASKSASAIINNDREKLLDYLLNNSRVVNISAHDDFYMLEAHTGTLGKAGNENPFKDRQASFAVLDKNLDQIDVIDFTNENFTSSNLRESVGNSLFILYRDNSTSSSPYILERWEIFYN